jgi:hypothetical protein
MGCYFHSCSNGIPGITSPKSHRETLVLDQMQQSGVKATSFEVQIQTLCTFRPYRFFA